MFASIDSKQLKVGLPVFIVEKDEGAIIAPLSYMMRKARGYYPGDSRYGRMLVQDPIKGTINWGVSLVFKAANVLPVFVYGLFRPCIMMLSEFPYFLKCFFCLQAGL